MAYVLEKIGSSRCALDAAKAELFTQKKFADLIYDAHTRGQDYYLARVHCKEKDIKSGHSIYYCYDAKQLCKYVFEMVITPDGRKIKIKNFKDPLNAKDISEINFFRLRFDTETPLKAEYIGNHVSFLESNIFRSKLFYQEDPLDALSVNFQFKTLEKLPYIKKKRFFDVFIFLMLLCIMGVVILLGFKGKKRVDAHEPTKIERSITEK